MNELVIVLGVVLIAFFLGSIPWGLIISRVFFNTDIREHGSGNIGTTNAMRSLGKVGGSAVFILDFGKGLLAGFIALGVYTMLSADGANVAISRDFLLALTTTGAVFGHIFSPWLHFHGGKGIAVAIGSLFVAFGIPGALIELAIFGVLVALTRYVSLGSIVSAAACPFLSLYFFMGDIPAIVCCAITGGVVVWAHHENIARLRQGTERRVGDKKKEA